MWPQECMTIAGVEGRWVEKRPKYGKDNPGDSHPGWWKGLGGGRTQRHVPESLMKEGDFLEGW